MEIREILQAAVKFGASDVHIVPERRPFLRINGKMRALNTDVLSAKNTRQMIFSSLSEDVLERFKKEKELDTSISAAGIGRFRLNVLNQKDGVGAVFRVIPDKIPIPEEIGLDEQIVKMINIPRGMVLVTGPTGSGKSTTLATMLNEINKQRREHIITIEDPIEYVYPKKNCVVTQREIGTTCSDYGQALKRAMRQDPDVALVGEMRDLDTISAVLTLAETGHLVFSTLHTTDAAQTVDRIIDVFPPYQQQQVRTQLAGVLKAVICQQLVPVKGGKGRVAAREIMIVNSAISNLIRDGKTHQIYSAIDTSGRVGMRSLDRDLIKLVNKGKVVKESAMAKANDPEFVRKELTGGL